MDENIINMRDLEEKVLSKNRYLTSFLTPLEVRKIKEYFSKKDNIKCFSYELENIELERTKVYLVKDDNIDYTYDNEYYYQHLQDYDKKIDYKINIIKIVPNKFAKKLVHKDYLGAILGLGIKREKIGDIIVNNDNTAYVFISEDISNYIMSELTKIGRENVKIEVVSSINDTDVSNDGSEKQITITSFRLDNFISHAFGISRNISSSLIEKEFVKVNYEIVLNNLYEVKQDDLISVRGYGRAKINLLDGENKKGRKRLKITVYTKNKTKY